MNTDRFFADSFHFFFGLTRGEVPSDGFENFTGALSKKKIQGVHRMTVTRRKKVKDPLTGGELVFAFKTPNKTNSGGGYGPGGGSQKLVVYTSSTPTLKSGVTAGGTEVLDGNGYYPATATGGTNVTLSNYSSSGGGPGGW